MDLLELPMISAEREPLSDVTTTDKEVKVVLEMPGIDKQSIKINAYDNSVEITSNDPKRKYHRKLDSPTRRHRYFNSQI